MLLSDVYRPEFIKADLEATDKEELFEEMVDLFCSATGNTQRDVILKALFDREAKMSTGIEHGIAIPHGKTDAVEKIYGVLGVSRQGIDYDSLDGKPVYLIMMILAPPVEAEKHLHLLQRMAEVLRNRAFFNDVMDCNSSAEIFAMIQKYEVETAETAKEGAA
jgi:PTS system fructose-specific IIC component/PTS system nitrogen regulatory IIA component